MYYADEKSWGTADPLMDDIMPYTTENGVKTYLMYQEIENGCIKPLDIDYIEERILKLTELGNIEEVEKLKRFKKKRLNGYFY